MTTRRYGWLPDLGDQRDHLFAAPPTLRLPPFVDLAPGMPPVYDQGQLGSCTGQATAGAHQFAQIKQMPVAFNPSRLFIYYQGRVALGTVNEDSGAQIRDCIKSLVKLGVCHETLWPYDIERFTNNPTDPCYTDALLHQVTSYQRITPTLKQLKSCLASGLPFVSGFSVYESFEDIGPDGKANMPGSEERLLGGHAVLTYGYDDAARRFKVRNSWSYEWGDHGDFTVPYEYWTDPELASDFWTLKIVEV